MSSIYKDIYATTDIYTHQDVDQLSNQMAVHATTKISLFRIKCWIAESKKRIDQHQTVSSIECFIKSLDKRDCLLRLERDQIDCSEMGGKDEVIKSINKWYK